jgi:polyisoprenoid-binding protein YceI
MNTKQWNRWIVVVAGLMWAGCGNPADKVPKAEVSSNTKADTAAATATPPAGESRSYVFGPENSSIEFVGSKVTGHHNGGFKKFSGQLKAQGNQLAPTGNKVEIETASLWADNERLTGHLKTPDFFNVAQFPTSTFETTAITPNATNLTVTGSLMLHGITRQISFPANIKVTPEGVEVDADFSINRMDFDVKFAGMPNDLIRKDVKLKLKVKAVPAKA